MSALRHVRGAPALRVGPPRRVLVKYAEEPKEGGTRLRVAQSVWMIAALQ